MGEHKAVLLGVLHHLILALRGVCCIGGLLAVMARTTVTAGQLLHDGTLDTQYFLQLVCHVIELAVCVFVCWRATCVGVPSMSRHHPRRVWPLSLQAVLVCITANIHCHHMDTQTTFHHVILYTPVLLFACLLLMSVLEVIMHSAGETFHKYTVEDTASEALAKKERVIKVCTIVFLLFILCVQCILLYRVAMPASCDPRWRNVSIVCVHMLLTLQTVAIICIQLYRASTSHLPAFSKVIILYLTVSTLSNAALTSMELQPTVITIYVLGAAALIFLPISRLAIMSKRQIGAYFKMDELRKTLSKRPSRKHLQVCLLRASTVCASIGAALAILALFWPWFAIHYEPAEELQVMNNSLVEMNDLIESISEELHAVQEALEELKHVANCQTITATTIASFFVGSTVRPLLQSLRVLMFVRRFSATVTKYSQRAVMLRNNGCRLQSLIDNTHQSIFFGVSVANVGMASLLLPVLLACASVLCIGLWSRHHLDRHSSVSILLLSTVCMLLINAVCLILLLTWPAKMTEVFAGVPLMRVSLQWLEAWPMVVGSFLAAIIALTLFLSVLVLVIQGAKDPCATQIWSVQEQEARRVHYDASTRLSVLLLCALFTLAAAMLLLGAVCTPWVSVTPVLKPSWARAVVSIHNNLDTNSMLLDDLTTSQANVCGLDLVGIPNIRQLLSTLYDTRFADVLSLLSNTLKLPSWNLFDLDLAFDLDVDVMLLPVRVLLVLPSVVCLFLIGVAAINEKKQWMMISLGTLGSVFGKISLLSSVLLCNILLVLSGTFSGTPMFDLHVRFHNGLMLAGTSSAVLWFVWLMLGVESVLSSAAIKD